MMNQAVRIIDFGKKIPWFISPRYVLNILMNCLEIYSFSL